MGADDTLLEEIRERHEYADTAWKPIRDEGAKDMRYISGNPWDPKDKKDREDAGRPCLALDELGQYVNQVVNDVLANPIGLNYDPAGNGANDAGAEFYENKAREIQYRSHAQLAFTTAFENMVCRSYGWCRVNVRYISDRSANQDLWFDPVVDPDSVLPDPDFIRPEGSDLKYLFVRELRNKKEFAREFPKAQITDFGADTMRLAPQWIKADKVQIAEYWTVATALRKLLLVARDGQDQPDGIFEDELTDGKLPAGLTVRRDRQVEQSSVMQYLTNGVEILKRTPWRGKYLPFACCFGKILYIDEGSGSERKILSMTRLARDPYMLYCYLASCEAEVVGAIPRNAWIGYKGQFYHPEDWAKASHEPVTFLEAEPTLDQTGTQVLPLPTRQPWDPPLQNLEIAKEAARRAIQAAMGISPLPTEAQRHNQKSGVALQQIESSGQRGAYHFTNSYKGMIRHVGVITEDLLDKVIDTARDTGVREADDTAKMVRVNDPMAMGDDGEPAPVSTKGDYIVTISTGPTQESQRAAASDFADSLSQTPLFPRVADLVVRSKQLGPLGDDIADRLTPPEFKKDPKNDPKQAPQQLSKAVQMIDMLTKELNAKNQIIETDGIKADAQLKLQALRNAGALAVAETNARAKGVQSANEAQVDALALLQDSTEQEADRQHDAHMAGAGADVASAQAAQGHQQALDQGDASAANAMAVQAAQPQPDAAGAAA